MIVSGGENVYPQDTENLFNARKDIAEAAVRGVDCPHFGQALCAWVVFRDKKAAELTDSEKRDFEEEMQAEAKQKLARHAVPRYFVYLDRLPRNPVGKVVPRKLPQPDTGA